MSCSQYDWTGYSLGELDPSSRKEHELHLGGCAVCRDTAGQLARTVNTLQRLPLQDPPRRISFVSDPVFEPSFWQRFWNSAPRLGFASAAMLTCAILAHGFLSQDSVPPSPPAQTASVRQQAISQETIQSLVKEELARQRPASMEPAVENADREEKLLRRIAELERRMGDQRKQDMRDVKDGFALLERQFGVFYRNASQAGGE